MQHSFAAKRHSVYRAFALLLTLVLIPAIQPASAAQSTVAGQVSGYATLHSVGIEIRIDGDNNHNARGTLAFRPAGNGAWQPALDLFRVDYTPDSPVKDITDHFNGFAGSIFFLDPGQRYELAVEISDPDGGNTRQTLSISTRPQPRKPTGGRRLHVRPGNGGGTGTAASPFLGIEEAQKHAHPGDTFLLHSGVYSGFDSGGEILLDTPGTSDSYIVWQAAQNASVVFDDPLRIAAGHLWIEGIHVRGHADVDNEYGLRTYNAPDDVVIKGNRFTDFYCKRPRIHTYFPHLTLCRLSPRIPRQRRKQWILPISPKARRSGSHTFRPGNNPA